MYKKMRGFTLVEVLISIVVLVIVVGGITALEKSQIQTGSSSKFSIQAKGLGQEGINLIKAISDKVQLKGSEPPAAVGQCVNPANKDTANVCPAGVYYIDGETLKKCNKCREKTDDPTVAGSQCPTTNLDIADKICADFGAVAGNLDGKEFTRTVIIP